MSLINEALKRTRDAAVAAQPRSDDVDGYRLGPGSRKPAANSRIGIIATIVVAVLAVGAGAVLGIQLIQHTRLIQTAFESAPEAQPAIPRVHHAPAANSSSTTPAMPATPKNKAEEVKASEDEPVAESPEKLKAEQVATAPASEPPPREPPKFLLQGVTRGATFREAMINGVNVREGDEIEGARVALIEARRVTLEFEGRDLVLRMP